MSASERLVLSRERLQKALRSHLAPPGMQTPVADGSLAAWLERLKSVPGAHILIDAISIWWLHHPLHTGGMAAAVAVKTGLKPLAQRHPAVLIVCAALAGGLLIWIRPWRWVPKSALFAGLLPQLLTEIVRPRHPEA
jgi:hypothetical protein